jgi:hypothetical protein
MQFTHTTHCTHTHTGEARFVDNTHDMLNNMLSISNSPFRKPPSVELREKPKQTHNSSQIPLLRELTSFVGACVCMCVFVVCVRVRMNVCVCVYVKVCL